MRPFVRDRIQHLRRCEAGTSAVEFAMIAPLLILMIFAIIQLGIAFHKGSSVQWASERVLRMAMVDANVTQAELQAQMDAELADLAGGLDIQVGYAVDRSGAVPIGRMTVDYAYPVTLPGITTFYARFEVRSSAPLLE